MLDAGALIRDDLVTKAIKEHKQCILTPHYGEAARLLDISSADVQASPLEVAKHLAKHLEAIIILKGPTTIISNGHQSALSLRGHPGMATGGMGDVLAGCLGAFLANTTLTNTSQLFERSAAAVYLHGLAGEVRCSTPSLWLSG